jgi:hypothetical protein
VSLIMGRLLGWHRRKRAAETRRYLELVAADQTLVGIDSSPVREVALAARAKAG